MISASGYFLKAALTTPGPDTPTFIMQSGSPTPAVGDSVAHILEEIGLEKCGTHGTTAALALLNDAVKKGGVMACSRIGGLSGAFIPVSEDAGMIDAAKSGALCIEKLEAMTAVCSVGLDMICIPGDTPADTISATIDELGRRLFFERHNRSAAKKSAPIKFFANALANSRDNSYGGGLVVYHTDSSFVCDDSGNSIGWGITRNTYHIKTN